MKICQRCGKEYEPKDDRPNRPSRYCSRSCGQPNQKTIRLIRCSVCQKEFERKLYHIKKSGERGQFCSFSCYARWQSNNTCGKSNPFYDPKVHEILICANCGCEFERPKYVRSGILKFCSRLCFQEFAGEHFRSTLPRGYGKSWISIRKRILDRDNHRCQKCSSQIKLVVHHLIEYKKFKDAKDAHAIDNLITVCRACHRRLHNTN